jgi:hypothetical protein
MWKTRRLRELYELMAGQGEQVMKFDWKVPGPQFRILWINLNTRTWKPIWNSKFGVEFWTSVDSNVYKVRIFVYAHKKEVRRITELLNKVIKL